jgi:hypothetical protein
VWSVLSSIRIDVWNRGIPWTQLLLRSARLDNDLNLRAEYRLSVICAYLLAISLIASLVWPAALFATVLLVNALLYLNASYYAWFVRQRGWWFAIRVFPLHLVHHLCNGVSFVWGSALFAMRRAGAITLPGALPAAPWSRHDQSLARTL